MKYTNMNERLKRYSFRAWCEGSKVSASGFYTWRKRLQESKPTDIQLARGYAIHKGKAGAPMLCADLNSEGITCSISTVSRRMKKANLRAKLTRKFGITTDSNHKLPLAPNRLKRQFKVDKPNKV